MIGKPLRMMCFMNLKMTTNSDCEIISLLYERVGLECVNLLDGVFAFVLFDVCYVRGYT